MINQSGYEAFISYKHHPIDMKVAQDVQKQIEHYRIPKYIQKKTGIKKFRHVFRDITELSGSADLPADIEEAIKQSDYLIVVCSKRTSESPWVTREIEMFLTCHDRKHILTVLVDGEPREVIPDILLKEQINIVGSDGTIFTEERDLEPLSCDYRKGFRIARNQEIPRLAARFLNCDYNELYRREMREQYRRNLILSGVALFLSTIAISYLLWSNREIENNYNDSIRQRMIYTASLGEQYLEDGRRVAALKSGLSSAGMLTEDELTLAPELFNCMEEASRIYNCGYDGAFDNIVNTQEFFTEGTVQKISTDNAGKYICCSDINNNLYIWSADQGRMIYQERWNAHISDLLITIEGQAIVASNSTVCSIDCETGEILWEQNYTSNVIHLSELPDSYIGIMTSVSIIFVDSFTSDIAEKIKLEDCIIGETPLDPAYMDITFSVCAESPNNQWVCVEISARTENTFEFEYYTGLFDIQRKRLHVFDNESILLYENPEFNKFTISDNGELYSLEIQSTYSGECFISKISVIDGIVEWSKNCSFGKTNKIRVTNGNSVYSLNTGYTGVSDYNISGKPELISVIGSKALILDASSGDTLKEIALPSDAILYSEDSDYYFMPGMIGYNNAAGNVTSVAFPVGAFDDAICVTDYTSWNQADEFIFVVDRSIYIYQIISDNTDIVKYDSTEEKTKNNELLVTNDGLIEIDVDESGTTSIQKNEYDNCICEWSTEIAEEYDQIIGRDSSEKYLYLLLESDDREIQVAQINLENGDADVFKVQDSHYMTEPYELSSIVKILGVQEDTLLYYSEWNEADDQSYVISRYNPQNNELEEHVLPFKLNRSCPGTVFCDDQLVCLSEQYELYVFNTDTWEYTLLKDEYIIDNGCSCFRVIVPEKEMYIVFPEKGKQLDVFAENSGTSYTVRGTSEIVAASNDKEILYILYGEGILNLYDLSNGKLLDTINLNVTLNTYTDSEVKKISENELVISCSDGVYVIDLEYKTVRTHVAAGIGYDEKTDGFYLGIRDKLFDKKSGGWVRRYSASEVLDRAEQMISDPA